MDAIKAIAKWMNPLWVFVGGMVCLAVAAIFFPAINSAASAAATATAGYSSNYFALSWALSGVRLIMWVLGIFLVLLSAGIAFLNRQ